jgi:hypothetical protein
LQNDLDEKTHSAFAARDETDTVKKELAECGIPVNIQLRRNEIKALMQRLAMIMNEFKDLKQADANYEGAGTDDIKQLVVNIEDLLAKHCQEGQQLEKYQTTKLDKYTSSDFISLDNETVIVEVREFK